MSRPRFSIAICLAITAVVLLSASQDPPPAGAGRQGVARPDAAVVRRRGARQSAAR